MKIGKITFLILAVSSFLVASMGSVVAADKILQDPAGDVIEVYTEEVVTDSPNIDIGNIDIIKATYSKDGRIITLTIQVEDYIENRGNIEDLTEFDESDDLDIDIDVVSYTFLLTTSEVYYIVTYVNNTCNLSYSSYADDNNGEMNLSTFSVVDDTITISFNLISSDETYSELIASSQYLKVNLQDLFGSENLEDIELFSWFVDEVNDIPLQIVIAEDSYDGLLGESISFDAFVSGGTEPYDYSWEFGDGKISEEASPTHTYIEAGEYTVTFTVTGGGSSESDTATVTIIDENGETDSNILIFIAIIALIAIVGVVVVIVIIRR